MTDAAPNTIAYSSNLKVRRTTCFAHAINLFVKKPIDQTKGLEDIRSKARNIVTYIRTSTTARERLYQIQQQMSKPTLKLIQEVDIRWNSAYAKLQRLHDQRKPAGAALVASKTDLTTLTSEEYDRVDECLEVLCHFNEATIELSEEKRVQYQDPSSFHSSACLDML